MLYVSAGTSEMSVNYSELLFPHLVKYETGQDLFQQFILKFLNKPLIYDIDIYISILLIQVGKQI